MYEEGRRLWLQDVSKNPAGQKAFHNGEWNHFRVRAVGNRFQTWVNGIPVTDYRDDLTSFGFIGLQVHGVAEGVGPYEAAWRNIKLRELK